MPGEPYILNGLGWEDGQRVPVVEPGAQGEPERPNSRGIEVEPLLDALMTAAKDSTEVGERVVLLAHLLSQFGEGPGVATAPKSLRELGRMLGCSHVTAGARLNTFRANFAGELKRLLNTERTGI